MKQTIYVTVAVWALTALTLSVCGCKSTTNPFFPSEHMPDEVRSVVDLNSVGAPIDQVISDGPNRLTYDKHGLQSISDSPDPREIAGWALCMAQMDQCTQEYIAEINSVPETSEFGQMQMRAEIEEAIDGCERCALVCAGLVKLGFERTWPFAVPARDTNPEIIREYRRAGEYTPTQDDITQVTSENEGALGTMADRGHIFVCRNLDGFQLLQSELQAERWTPSKIANSSWRDWFNRINEVITEGNREKARKMPTWLRDKIRPYVPVSM